MSAHAAGEISGQLAVDRRVEEPAVPEVLESAEK
jgi:hypothetical protein